MTYIAAWSALVAMAVVVAAVRRREVTLLRAEYWRFLCAPWRLVTFVAAAVPLVAFAPFSGDPTWDHADAAFMAALTFATAPWCVGVLFRAVRHRTRWPELYVAICTWLFSASWSYDLYIYLRDGTYPPTWATNIAASSVLYLAGGLFWNLEWRSGRGARFAFMGDDWPNPRAEVDVRRLLLWGLPFMVIYGLIFAVAWSSAF